MNKVIKIVLSPDAEETYNYLKEMSAASKRERILIGAINRKLALIKLNCHYGNPLAKNLIPDEYKIKYGITNLFRVELPHFWRMLYTLADGDAKIEIIAFVLDMIDHTEYNRKFGYRKN